MSEIESVDTRRDETRRASKGLIGAIQVIAALGIVSGICAAILNLGGWGVPSAFTAFVVLLCASAWPRR